MNLRYDFGMKYMDSNDIYGVQHSGQKPEISSPQEEGSAMWIVGWTSVAVGIAAVGLYVGRELRARYKFNHRTQYDFFSHAGDLTWIHSRLELLWRVRFLSRALVSRTRAAETISQKRGEPTLIGAALERP